MAATNDYLKKILNGGVMMMMTTPTKRGLFLQTAHPLRRPDFRPCKQKKAVFLNFLKRLKICFSRCQVLQRQFFPLRTRLPKSFLLQTKTGSNTKWILKEGQKWG